MIINCYYYAPHHHCLRASHLEADLDQMVEIGCDAVSICVHHHDLVLWFQQRLKNVIDLAHQRRLKVHAVPNFWCGIVAGWIPGICGPHWEQDATPDKRYCRDFYQRTLREMLEKYDFDGIIWDEPRPANDAVRVSRFLDEMSGYALEQAPNLVISLFCESSMLEFIDPLLSSKHIEYIGTDGHIRSEDHAMHRMKPTLFSAHRAVHQRLVEAGRKTFYLLEGQRHRDEDLEDYLRCLPEATGLPMDHLMFYFDAHEMSPSRGRIHTEATWDAIRQLKADRRSPAH